MAWERKGLIFAPRVNHEWMSSHAQLPFVQNLKGEIWRIYFGTRDSHNRTLPTYIEVSANEPSQVLYVHDRPVVGLGELGCFDDQGVMPSWIIERDSLLLL